VVVDFEPAALTPNDDGIPVDNPWLIKNVNGCLSSQRVQKGKHSPWNAHATFLINRKR